MTGDGLYDPLGQPSSEPVRGRAPTRLWAVFALVGLVGASAAGAYALSQRGQVDKTTAVVPIVIAKPVETPAVVSAPTPASPAQSGALTAEEIDQRSGVKVTRLGGSAGSSATIIKVPQDLAVSLQRAPDLHLVEQNRYGLLPRRGSDGARPLDVYARPVVVDSTIPSGAPRIALVVGGMGLNAPLTAQASATLPPAVTLAFAPYGDVLEAQVQNAREAGHEAILQVPMESAGTATAPAMSHLLTTGDGAKETLDRLHWHMARFTGYVGLANFLGSSFTADAGAFTPVLQETAQRGLMFFEDGTVPRSQAAKLAPGFNLPLLRADLVLDATPVGDAIDVSLKKLEQMARDRGVAIGFASGLPVSIQRVAAYANGLAGRGIALVPLSSLADSSVLPTRAASQP